MLEHELGAPKIRHERPNRLLDDQPHTDCSRQVIDDVAAIHELVDDRRLEDAVDDEMKALTVAEMLDVLQRPCREIIENPHVPAVIEELGGEV